MIDQREILWGVLAPPVLVAAGIMLTALSAKTQRLFTTGFIIGVVVALSVWGFRGFPTPGRDVHDWAGWIALIGGMITVCSLCAQNPWWSRLLVRLAITGAASYLLLWRTLEHGELSIAIITLVVVTLAWTALIFSWEQTQKKTTPGVSVVSLVVVGGLTSLSLLLFNTMTHAQFAGIATAALSAAAVLSWWKPTWYHAASAVTVSAFFFPALMLLGHYYANLPSWTLPFLALAGVAPLVTANEKIRSLAAWKRIGIAVSVIMLITAPVIIWGVVTSARAASSAGYY
jgi:hypothetical protein